MRLRIPATSMSTVKELGLKSWADRADADLYFPIIDSLREHFKRLAPDFEPEPKNIVFGLVGALDAEGALVLHATQKGADFDTDEKWQRICVAAAWCILQRYTREKEDNSWP